MDLYAPPSGGPLPSGEPAEKEKVPPSGGLSPLPGIWQGRLDSNQRMRESKSLALPLGYVPMQEGNKHGDRGKAPIPCFLWGGRWDSNPRHPEPQSGALTN